MSGPSGAGKSTIAAAILRRRPDLVTVVSRTTREPRADDGRGKVYAYLARDEFERWRDEGRFLEWAEVHGELYGTPRQDVEASLARGSDVLLEIDPQGARQVKSLVPDSVTVFILPPSWDTLETRLRSRGTESEEKLLRRLDSARRELAAAGEFDHRVVNDRLEQAVDEVDRILERVMKR